MLSSGCLPALGCASSWFSAHSQPVSRQMVGRSSFPPWRWGAAAAAAVAGRLISNSFLFIMLKLSHIYRCWPTTRRKGILALSSATDKKKLRKDLSFIEKERRRERDREEENLKENREKRQDRRHRRMDAWAPSYTVLMIKWGLAYLFFTVIASSLMYIRLQRRMSNSQRKMSTLL